LTELNYTYSKNSNNITRNSVLRRSVASCGVLRSLDGPVAHSRFAQFDRQWIPDDRTPDREGPPTECATSIPQNDQAVQVGWSSMSTGDVGDRSAAVWPDTSVLCSPDTNGPWHPAYTPRVLATCTLCINWQTVFSSNNNDRFGVPWNAQHRSLQSKSPSAWLWQDGKRLCETIILAWSRDKTLACDVTVPDIIIRRRTRHQNSHFGAKLGKDGVDRCKPNLTRSKRCMGLSYAKEIMSIYSAVWALLMN